MILSAVAPGVIIHEMAHQLDRTPGHYPDSDGNGTANQPSDLETVQFDYTQRPRPAGYVFEDYVAPVKYGHAFKSQIGSFITNMLLDRTSFLDPPT